MSDQLTALPPNDSAQAQADVQAAIPAMRESKPSKGQTKANKPHTGGKAPIYTKEREAIILEAVDMGLAPGKAAQKAGITEHVLRAWVKRYPNFGRRIATARANSEFNLLKGVKEADKLWQNKAWLLERAYGYSHRQEITGANAGPINLHTISKETLQLIAKVRGPEQVRERYKEIKG